MKNFKRFNADCMGHRIFKIQKSILERLILFALCFVLGYMSYKTIPYAFAECATTKTIILELDSVSSENQVDDVVMKEEKDRWPASAKIFETWFWGSGTFEFNFDKKEK